PDGAVTDVELIADTGCPQGVIVGLDLLHRVRALAGENTDSNFGELQCGWVRVAIPDIGLDVPMLGYGSDKVRATARQSDPAFEGVVGLPIFRLAEYGGNADEFWIRTPS